MPISGQIFNLFLHFHAENRYKTHTFIKDIAPMRIEKNSARVIICVYIQKTSKTPLPGKP